MVRKLGLAFLALLSSCLLGLTILCAICRPGNVALGRAAAQEWLGYVGWSEGGVYLLFTRFDQPPLSGTKLRQHESMWGAWIHTDDNIRLPMTADTRETVLLLAAPASLRLATALTAFGPLIAYSRAWLRRWERKKRGQCLGCGYSLTGNVSGRCPECGKPLG